MHNKHTLLLFVFVVVVQPKRPIVFGIFAVNTHSALGRKTFHCIRIESCPIHSAIIMCKQLHDIRLKISPSDCQMKWKMVDNLDTQTVCEYFSLISLMNWFVFFGNSLLLNAS